MKPHFLRLIASVFFLTFFSATAGAAQCSIKYNLKGWSVFYKAYKGTAVISCPNGQSARVNLSLKGGGFTFGSSDITDGKGVINGVGNINEVYGTYFAMDGHAGFLQSVEARLLFKGANSVGMAGRGGGFDLGFSFGALTIKP
ncbi:MAG: hypothetical protein GQ532_12010 [Methylomarinum sp.]|nr:hypothetical protein [Methylomarinum sp.]